MLKFDRNSATKSLNHLQNLIECYNFTQVLTRVILNQLWIIPGKLFPSLNIKQTGVKANKMLNWHNI